MKEMTEKEIELAKRAYLAETEQLRNQYYSRRCSDCGKEIVPGNSVWVPRRPLVPDEIYCSAECYTHKYHGYLLHYYETRYESLFTRKDGGGNRQ